MGDETEPSEPSLSVEVVGIIICGIIASTGLRDKPRVKLCTEVCVKKKLSKYSCTHKFLFHPF